MPRFGGVYIGLPGLLLAGLFVISACQERGVAQDAPIPDASPPENHFRVPSQKAEAESAPPVDQCMETYRKFFGSGGCLPNILSAERMRTACDAYLVWSQAEDDCGAGALADFYTCLGEVDCVVFEETGDFNKAFTACRRRFASAMNYCLHK